MIWELSGTSTREKDASFKVNDLCPVLLESIDRNVFVVGIAFVLVRLCDQT